MLKHAENILAEALELPPVERAELVENLLSSFEFKSRGTINALWAQEAEDRVDACERDEMTAIPVKDVFIVAVMHLSREPETWKSRLKKKDL